MERCVAVKDAITAGIWGNSNYDPQKEGQEGARRQILEQIEEQFNKALDTIYNGAEAESDEIDWDDPFFAASKAPRIGQPPVPQQDGTGEDDRLKEFNRMLKDLDQT